MVHLPLLGVSFPSNTYLAFSLIIDLANLKIIPVDWVIDTVFGSSGSSSSSSSFGYSGNIFKSVGLMLILLILVIFGGVVFWNIVKVL
jgi:hypothetical protein